MSEFIIAVDLGGTQIRAARYDTELNMLERAAQPTLAHHGIDVVVDRLLETIEQVSPEDRDSILGLGISAPGPINPHTGTIFSPPNLPGWEKVPLRDIIQERLGCKTYLGNDANVAALAEATRGAAQGYKYIIYLTVSTGIGSGIIDDGHLVIGTEGLGAEAGHMMMVVNGRIVDLEEEAAGPAIARKTIARLEAGTSSIIPDMVNGQLENVTAQIVGEAAEAGDALAIEVIQEAGKFVGLGIVTLMHLFNPQIFVVGGGVSKTGDLLFDPMRATVQEYTLDKAYWADIPIVPAALGDNVALVGAAALVATRGGRSV